MAMVRQRRQQPDINDDFYLELHMNHKKMILYAKNLNQPKMHKKRNIML
jgi:hypothetical protein